MPTGTVAAPEDTTGATALDDQAVTNATTPAFDNPLADETAQDASPATTSSPSNDSSPTTSTSEPVSAPSLTQPPAGGESNDLLDLKQQALGQLTPLVDHLEQSPEEKFRTTMMMIQSTDNQTLLKDAFTAAQAITDDKARAQALLDVINEINYFTQKKD